LNLKKAWCLTPSVPRLMLEYLRAVEGWSPQLPVLVIIKALIGTEKYHYLIRTRLLGFVCANSNIFMPNAAVKWKWGTYCLAMDIRGVWGAETETLAAAAQLQAPMYTKHTYEFKFILMIKISLPLSPVQSVTCNYHDSMQRLVASLFSFLPACSPWLVFQALIATFPVHTLWMDFCFVPSPQNFSMSLQFVHDP